MYRFGWPGLGSQVGRNVRVSLENLGQLPALLRVLAIGVGEDTRDVLVEWHESLYFRMFTLANCGVGLEGLETRA